MHIFSGIEILALFDGIGAALLGAAGGCRGRNLGAQPAGAILAGMLCGISAGLLRELILNGSQGTRLVISMLPDDACLGAIAGVLAPLILKNRGDAIFTWIDAVSMGFASSLGALAALPELGIGGALVLGILCGLCPGIIRDLCLGDTPMAMDKSWYAVSPFIGCMGAIAIAILGPGRVPGEFAVLGGTLLTIGCRWWGDKTRRL